jgi:hypothetical protein
LFLPFLTSDDVWFSVSTDALTEILDNAYEPGAHDVDVGWRKRQPFNLTEKTSLDDVNLTNATVLALIHAVQLPQVSFQEDGFAGSFDALQHVRWRVRCSGGRSFVAGVQVGR